MQKRYKNNSIRTVVILLYFFSVILVTNKNKEPNVVNAQELYSVIRVEDGDTMEVKIKGVLEKVRILGLDTPDIDHIDKPLECFGTQALIEAEQLLHDKKVYFETDPDRPDRDQNGRLLRYVYREDGLLFNNTMIQEGYGFEYAFENQPYAKQAQFSESQSSAQTQQKGLWNSNTCAGNRTLATNVRMLSGVLLKSTTNPQVYVIEGLKKRYISSPNILESQFRWDQVILLSQKEVDAIPVGSPLGFADGTLVSHKGVVYVIEDGLRRPIPSEDMFLKLGYRWDTIIPVSEGEIALHASGAMVQDASRHPNGTLIETPNNKVFLLQNGKKRYIPTPAIFEAQFKWTKVVKVSQSESNSYFEGSQISFPDGKLVSMKGGVYIMDSGKRNPISSPQIFQSHRLKWNLIQTLSSYEESLIPEASAINPRWLPDGLLVKVIDKPEIYRVFGNSLHHIISPTLFNENGYSWADVINYNDADLNLYKKSSIKVGFKNGSLIAGNRTVYVIQHNLKRPIASAEVFIQKGYNWNNVRNVSQTELDLHQNGEMVL